MPAVPIEPWKISGGAENAMIACGAAFLIVPLVVPRHIAAYLFVLVWIGFILLLDPLNRRLAPAFVPRRSLRRICAALLRFSCFRVDLRLAVGILELLGAREMALHVSHVPADWKIFEMPAPGYLGFIPFALECFAMYVTAAWLAGWLKRVK